MASIQPNVEIVDRWKREKVLGSGGFGIVVLWRNLDTNETVAIKQCRWGHDVAMTPKLRQKWTQEVEIMLRLSHPGVVKALAVPPPLDVDKSELPLLAMEYCSGGDLRKVLCKAEHCCGLPEDQIRTLLQNIASAIFYLHSLRIIHRDLKPENIILQEVNGEIKYKLIDLGYAKQLDQGSLCTSFVGTLQYLAPELFHSQTYSVTVDYWSLGLVTHEAITGQRPFLPYHSPAQWIPVVSRKSSEDICVYLDDTGSPVFSKEITPFTHISRIFKLDMEKWLQVMLEWNPKKRGTCNDGTSGFNMLDEILNKKVLQVFHVESCGILSCEMNKEMVGTDVKKWLEEETNIAAQAQIIISNKGTFLNDLQDLSEQCTFAVDDFQFCLFTQNLLQSTIKIPICLPSTAKAILNHRMQPMAYALQKKTWMQCVFFAQMETRRYQQLVQAYRTYLSYLFSKLTQVREILFKMENEMNKLAAVSEFYKVSLKRDMTMYEKHASSKGVTSDNMFEKWKESKENLKNILKMREKGSQLSSKLKGIANIINDVRECPYTSSSSDDPLKELEKKIVTAYEKLKLRSKEQRSVKHDNLEMVQLLCQYVDEREKIFDDVFSFLRKAIEACDQVNKLELDIEEAIKEACAYYQEILALQEKRQKDIWRLMDALVNQVVSLKRNQMPFTKRSSHKSESLSTNDSSWSSAGSFSQHASATANDSRIVDRNDEFEILEPEMNANMGDYASVDVPSIPDSSSSLSSESASLSLVVEKCVEDSIQRMNDSETLLNEMKTLFASLKPDSNRNVKTPSKK